MGVTAGIFLASILLKEMRYLVYIIYLWFVVMVVVVVEVIINGMIVG
jgi:predicted membrane channel-forming protein YqfA (hemolysin III family)